MGFMFNLTKDGWFQPPPSVTKHVHAPILEFKEKLDQRHHPALMICALFVNADDEDQKVYDEAVMNSKIEDWQKEGYDVNDFFHLAWNLVPSFIEVYKEDLQSISNPTQGKKSKASKDKK